MKTSVISYPRVGELRELKFATEKYFKGQIKAETLQETAAELRRRNLEKQQAEGIDFIPSNDFSFYDNVLDVAWLINAVPARYQALGLSALDTYFAMARGYQGAQGDVHALPMKKWFNTNYHYLVPEIEADAELKLNGSKVFDEYEEARALGIQTKPVLVGPFTFIRLATLPEGKQEADYAEVLVRLYGEILERLAGLGAEWIQLDEPALVQDLSEADSALAEKLYQGLAAHKGRAKLLLQTYFGDVRDCYELLCGLPVDGIGLDLVEGRKTAELLAGGFPRDKVLFAGLVNGKNIWRNNYTRTIAVLEDLSRGGYEVVLSTSCSLLHSPYTLRNEKKLDERYLRHFAFAEEKLRELAELKEIAESKDAASLACYQQNKALFAEDRHCDNAAVQAAVAALGEADFVRQPAFAEREQIQKAHFAFPLLPTTTIGSFPQTSEVKANRSAFKKGEISEEAYTEFNKKKIAECIELQEKLGLDVLVHGEFERNDMVEYFGENLEGFLFTEKAWVQSYGTRCVKPPIVWGDVSRRQPITVDYASYAQSLTKKRVKGMLTGPVTILNWSFPREDVSLKTTTLQLALAIRAEVLDLEAAGVDVIQIDEAALREKLPLRKVDWHSEYLDWAIPAFRLVHSGVKPQTQIHTHMCYSEFSDIIRDINGMDADVISFEAARSDLKLVDTIQQSGFETEVGPGIYDIHSPRIPSVEELKAVIEALLEKLPKEKLWINPDCGLKTRGEAETVPSLAHLVQAAEEVRASLS